MNRATPPIFPGLRPPPWLVREVQQRIVLLLNHVLQQEPEAMSRISRQKGRISHLEYAGITIELIATPAGLLDLAPADCKPDLSLKLLDNNPLLLAQTLLKGDKPRMEISGDVMLAAEMNWLVDHVRWDIEEDLSRILGDVAAHSLMQGLRSAGQMLRQFASRTSAANGSTAA